MRVNFGVYYTDNVLRAQNPNAIWIKYGNGLPGTGQMGNISLNKCAGTVRVSGQGMGLWEVDLPNFDVHITTNTTWNTPRVVSNNIVIDPGAKLTINNTNIKMIAGTKITVQPNGMIDINNSTIESSCDENMWSGIIVDGISTQYQIYDPPTGKYYDHGHARITNSIIRDAGRACVTLENGGVVTATNSRFENSRKGLEFHIYTPANVSKIKSCVFEVNDDLKDPNVGGPDAHVTAWAVDGVLFQGCTFQNIAPVGSNGYNLGMGIRTLDAFFKMDNYCPSCTGQPQNTNRSLFKGLSYGIYAETYSASFKSTNIRNTDFDRCERGAFFKDVDFAKLQYCNFNNIPDGGIMFSNLPYGFNSPYGLYFLNCQNYLCENNTFNGIIPGSANNIGLIVNGSNQNATRAYYCDFKNLKVGSSAVFDNYNNTAAVGLKFNCNKYQNDVYDVTILGSMIQTPANNSIDIDHVQGSYNFLSPSDYSKTVRNLYSAACVPNNNNQYFDARNTGSYALLHWNHSFESGNGGSFFTRPQTGCYDPTKLNINNVLFTNFTRDGFSCPITGANNSGGPCVTCNPQSINNTITPLKASLQTAMQPLIDGNSQALIDAINSNMSLGNLKNLMIQYSPYLSDEVLKLYFAKANTPAGHIKIVHDKNKPVSDAVWEVIQNRNFPNDTITMNSLTKQQNVGGVSERTSKEAEVNGLKSEITYLFNEKVRLFLTDSVYMNDDSVKVALANGIYSDVEMKLIDFYISAKDYLRANAQITALKAKSPDFREFCDFKTDLITALQNPDGIQSYTSSAAAMTRLNALANNDFAIGQGQARALSSFLTGTAYYEWTFLPNQNGTGARESALPSSTVVAGPDGNYIKAIPNPASDQVIISYNLQEGLDQATIALTDILGKMITSTTVSSSKSAILIDVSKLTSGVYLYGLLVNGELVESKKLIIVK